jgi:hypothetical protein
VSELSDKCSQTVAVGERRSGRSHVNGGARRGDDAGGAAGGER